MEKDLWVKDMRQTHFKALTAKPPTANWMIVFLWTHVTKLTIDFFFFKVNLLKLWELITYSCHSKLAHQWSCIQRERYAAFSKWGQPQVITNNTVDDRLPCGDRWWYTSDLAAEIDIPVFHRTRVDGSLDKPGLAFLSVCQRRLKVIKVYYIHCILIE